MVCMKTNNKEEENFQEYTTSDLNLHYIILVFLLQH